MDSRCITNSSLIVRSRLMVLMRSGALGVAGGLPTERELRANPAVSRGAVGLVIEALKAEGLVWRRQGKGSFALPPQTPIPCLAQFEEQGL